MAFGYGVSEQASYVCCLILLVHHFVTFLVLFIRSRSCRSWPSVCGGRAKKSAGGPGRFQLQYFALLPYVWIDMLPMR